MHRLSEGLIRLSRGWVALAALAVFVLFMVLILPGQTERAEAASRGADTPDLSLVYSAGDLYAMAEAYGPDGRAEYVRIRFTFDLAWPLVYTFLLVTGIGWSFGKVFAPGSRWRLSNLVPLLGMLLDFLENTATSLVMLRYPSPAPLPAALAPAFTLTKWIVLGIGFALLATGLAAAAWKAIARKK